MSDVDTSAEAVEAIAKRLKRDIDWRPGSLCEQAAATLRALLAERDAALAEAARLREALEGMLAAFEYDGATEGECNACHAARTALAKEAPHD
jgi:hypothetical protein